MIPSQLATLKANINADPAFNALKASPDGRFAIAAAYNALASPDYWIWRTDVSKSEFTNSVSPSGTTFSWVGTGFITRAQGERDAWREIFSGSGNGTVNAGLSNVRQAFADIFSGATAPAPANRTHLLAVGRRKARRIEKLLSIVATGSGNAGGDARGAITNPDALTFEGTISADDVEAALQLP